MTSPRASDPTPSASRRSFLSGAAAACVAGPIEACGEVGGRSSATASPVESSALSECEALLQLSFDAGERAQILATIDEQLDSIRAVRSLNLANSDAPALIFDPRLPGVDYPGQMDGAVTAWQQGTVPSAGKEDIAFAPVSVQAGWLRNGQVSSRTLTDIYFKRIAAYDAVLGSFITVTPDLARAQADRADVERASGIDRGPLHGIPYGLKDFIDTAGVATTWGATPYRDRSAREDAAVVARLERAGAVLIGKTSTGALAYGKAWFGGRTRSPWNPAEGSSGSSAGTAAAVAGVLCGFAVGTETVGSIVTPASRCGSAGLRPTFGRIPRTGTMALCWSLDKIGPLCRTAADTALVLAAINGRDGRDPSSLDHGFAWNDQRPAAKMRVGYMPAWFERAGKPDKATLDVLRDEGVDLVELDLPDWRHQSLFNVVEIEAAAAFQDLTLSDLDDELVWQAERACPNTWLRAHFFPAVDLIQADRFRRRVMHLMHEKMSGLDAVISPNFGDTLRLITTFTGHPCLTVRAGFVEHPSRTMTGEPQQPGAAQPTFTLPENVMLWGSLFEEHKLLTLGSVLDSAMGASRPAAPRSLAGRAVTR